MSTTPTAQKSTVVRFGVRTASKIAFRALQSTSTSAAAAALERAFLTPRRPRAAPDEQAFLASGRSERVRSPAAELAVWSWGEGRTVLLVHGWGSRASRYHTLAPALVAAGFRVVAFDSPGHGDSSGRKSSLPETARAIRFLARRERERRGGWPHALIAHSFGGAAAILAQEGNIRFARNVFLAPAVDFDGYLLRMAEAFAINDGTMQRMIRRVERRIGFSWDSIRVTRYAHQFSAPALIMHDPADPEVPFADAQALSNAWSGSRLVRTPGLGHRRLLHDAQVVQHIARFVSDRRDDPSS